MALPDNPITRKEMYLAAIAGQEVQIPDVPITREEAYLNQIAKEGTGTKVIANPDDVAEDVLHKVEIDGEIYSVPSGGGGSDDYLDLNNLPQVNGVELKGNKSTSDLGRKFEDLPDAPTIPNDLADLQDDSLHRLVTDTEKATWNGKSDFSGSYADLSSKPQVNGVELSGNKTTGDLGINADNVMMSDGVTSVEEALDDVKSGLTNMGNVTKLGYVQGTGEVSLSDNFNNYRYLFFTVGYYDSGYPSYGTAMFPTLMAPRGVAARVVCATEDDTNAKSVVFTLNDTNNKLSVSRTFDANRYLTLYGVV
jgi:hypothetical protein